MKTLHAIRSIPWVIVLALLIPIAGRAQNGELLRAELEQTDQIITRGQGVVTQSHNTAAIAALEQAQAVQRQAWEAFNATKPVLAHMLTKRARELVRSALAIGRVTEQADELVQRRLERAQERLDRAHEAIDNGGCNQFQGLLDAASDNLKRAWELYRSGKLRPALKLANQIEDATDRILEKCGPATGDLERYQSRRDNVAALIDQANQALSTCNDQNAAAALKQAKETLELSDQLNSSGKSGAALGALRRAREAAVQAMNLCGGSDRLMQRYQSLAAQADRLGEKAGGLDGEKAKAVSDLLRESHAQLEQALAQIQSGNTKMAAASLQAANLALRQVQSYFDDHH